MARDARAYLWEAREAARKVAAFTRGRTLQEFQSDELLHSAVERQFEVIGEALSQLARGHADVAGQIPDLARIVGLRNLLIHGYAIVDHEILWRVIHESLPGLRETLDRLLE